MANYNLTQTGAEVQVILDRVAAGYIYMGTADLTTTPDTTNPNVCYLLKAVGTYTNFGNIQHASGIGIALWNGTAWSYQNVPQTALFDTTELDTKINLGEHGLLKGAIMGTPTWSISTYTHYAIPVNGGEEVQFTLNGASLMYCAFLKSYTIPVSGATPDFCTNYSGRQQKAKTFYLPQDCKYFIINNPINTYAVLSLKINGIEYIKGVYNSLSFVAGKLNNYTLSVISHNLANPANIVTDKYVNSGGSIASGTGWAYIEIPVTGGKTYAFGGFYLGRSAYYMWENSSKEKISVHEFGDPNGTTTTKTATAPSNAAYMVIDIATSSSPSNPYQYLQINEGTQLFEYDQYDDAINTLYGKKLSGEDVQLQNVVNSALFHNPKMYNDFPNVGYVNTSGVLTSGGYNTTNYIKVSKGDTLVVKQISGSYSVAILSAYSSQSESDYVSGSSIIGTGSAIDITYIVPTGVNYVRLSSVRTNPTTWPLYGLIPYVPYISENSVAESANDQATKVTPLGVVNDMVGNKSLRLYPQTKLPCVSFQFDDIPTKDSEIVSLFESYSLVCGFAFIASTSNISSKGELYKNYQRRGFNVLNHSVDGTVFNTTNYTYSTAQTAIRTALNRIQGAGIVCNGFVSPSSEMASSFLPILKASHAYAFTSATTSATANGRQQNTCELHRYSLQSNTLAQIEQYIDDCITNDQIITFYGHAADLVADGDTSVFSIAKIAAVIEYCIAKRDNGLLYVGNTDDCVKYFFDL